MSTSTEEAIAIGQAGAALNAEKDKRRIFGDTGDSNTDPVIMTRDIDMNGHEIYGLTGVGGLQGPQGEQGEEGPTGLTGPMGPQGETGPQGEKGDTGATGAQGPQGDTGPQGPQGDTGPQGVKGDAGATGAQGPAGPQGAVGPQGPIGATGPAGDDGVGVPAGGTTGQVLRKASNSDHDTEWGTVSGGAGGAVDSVNTQTGDVVLDQDDIGDGTTYKQYSATEKTKLAGIEASADVTDAANVSAAGAFMKSVDDTDDITEGATNKFATAAEKTKLGHITVTQAVNLDTMESDIAGKQASDADLTAIAALDSSTSGAIASDGAGWIKKTYAQLKTALGLVKGDVGLGNVDNVQQQPLDADLTTIAAMNSATSGMIASDGSGWIQKTYAQVKTALGLTKSDVGLSNVPNTDATARANHTGTQTASTISDFNSAADARVAVHTGDATDAHAASAITNTPAGNIAATTVQAAINELDTEKAASSHTHSGLAPAGGTTGQVLKKNTNTDYDYGWAADNTGGGGGSPAGNSGEIQYNNGGAFAGAAEVEIDQDKLKLVSGADPSAPTGGLLLYSKSIAGRHLPKIIGPSGIDTVMQVGLHGNAVAMVAPASGTTAPTQWGITLTTAATMSLQQTIASANPWLATWRKRFATSTTAGNLSGMRTAYAQWFRGNAAGYGGFFFRTKFGHNINLNGSQCFVGLCASTGALAATAGAVAALLNMIGVGYDTTDANTGNWQLFRNDGSGTATKVDLGSNAARSNVSHGYDLIIYCPPGAATEIFVRIVNIHTGVIVLDTSYTTDLPAVNVGMAFKAEINNGAVAAAANLEVAKVYIESDY